MSGQGRRRLIVTADDFGLHPSVNAAVVQANQQGILGAASLMVAAPAAAEAVALARQLPQLAVGLLLVLADGKAVLPPERSPDLVDADGRFSCNMVSNGVRFFFLPWVREQLAAEIRAQFEAFAATGLVLDHVNAHKHFHLHPTVLSLIIQIGQSFGLRAVRVPAEPGTALGLRPWLALMRWRLRQAGFLYNDQVFGLSHSGGMDESVLLRVLQNLPEGLSEIYLHPATENGLTPTMTEYRHTDELAALLSFRVQQAADGAHLCQGFRDAAATA